MQETLFIQTPAGLAPRQDPYAHQKSRINDIKNEHYQRIIHSPAGKRQVDLVFDALMAYPDSTDREIQAVLRKWGYEIEISAIPARRADIGKFFPGYWVESSGKRICKVTGTEKAVWRIKQSSAPSLT